MRPECTVDLQLYPTLLAMPFANDTQDLSRFRRLQLVRPIFAIDCRSLQWYRDKVHDLCYADLYHIYFGVESREAFTREFLKVCLRRTMIRRLTTLYLLGRPAQTGDRVGDSGPDGHIKQETRLESASQGQGA